jgi:hypothetical protein
VNERLRQRCEPEQVDIIVRKVEQAERDEMWSVVGSKNQQRWVWQAIDYHTGQVLAYVLGARDDHSFLELKALLEPFSITRFSTDSLPDTFASHFVINTCLTVHFLALAPGRPIARNLRCDHPDQDRLLQIPSDLPL